MRILYFSRDCTVHDRRFLTGLANSRHEIWFLSFRNGNHRFGAGTLPEGVKTIDSPLDAKLPGHASECLIWMEWFEKALTKIKPDFLQAGPVQTCGLMAALSSFRPYLIVSWGSDMLRDAHQDSESRWATRHALRNSRWLLCDCDAVKRSVRDFVPYADERIVQFPWGIDLEDFRPGPDTLGLRDRPGWKDSFIFLSTRSWEPIYDIPTLLEAFNIAYRRNNRLRLVMLAGGSQAAQVKAFLEKEDLTDVVFCPGQIDNAELPGYFRAAGAYLACSLSDGSSISLLEALATGIPVIATDIPSNKEWIEEGVNGWLGSSGNAAEFAEALIAVSSLTDQERSAVRQKNRAVAESRADWKRNFPRLLEACDQIEGEHFP